MYRCLSQTGSTSVVMGMNFVWMTVFSTSCAWAPAFAACRRIFSRSCESSMAASLAESKRQACTFQAVPNAAAADTRATAT